MMIPWLGTSKYDIILLFWWNRLLSVEAPEGPFVCVCLCVCFCVCLFFVFGACTQIFHLLLVYLFIYFYSHFILFIFAWSNNPWRLCSCCLCAVVGIYSTGCISMIDQAGIHRALLLLLSCCCVISCLKTPTYISSRSCSGVPTMYVKMRGYHRCRRCALWGRALPHSAEFAFFFFFLLSSFFNGRAALSQDVENKSFTAHLERELAQHFALAAVQVRVAVAPLSVYTTALTMMMMYHGARCTCVVAPCDRRQGLLFFLLFFYF